MEVQTRQSRLVQPGDPRAHASSAPTSAPGTNQKSQKLPAAPSHSPTRKSQLKPPSVTARVGVEFDLSDRPSNSTAIVEPVLQRTVAATATNSTSAAIAMLQPDSYAASDRTFELEDRILQLSKELSLSKSENESLIRQLERCNQQLQEQRDAQITQEQSLRQRHDQLMHDLNKEVAELRFSKTELEHNRGKLENDLTVTKQELQKSKMQAGQNENNSLALEDELKMLRNRLRLAEDRLQQERGEKATVLAESEVRLTSENCSLDASNRELERALKTERENAQHADERCKALRDQIRKLNQQLATRPIAYELLALNDANEDEQFAVEKTVLESKWTDLPDTIKVNCEDVKSILTQFSKDENLPLDKYSSNDECLMEVTKCLWYRNQLLVKRLNGVTLTLKENRLSLEEFPRALAEHDSKAKKQEEIASELNDRLSNVEETRRNMELMFKCKLNSLKIEKAELEVQNKHLKEEIESLTSEMEEFKRALAQARSEKGEQPRKVGEPSREELDQAIEKARMNEEVKQLKKSDAEKHQFVTQLRKELVDLQYEFSRVKQQNADLHTQLKEAESVNQYSEIVHVDDNKQAAQVRALEEEVNYWKERSKQLAREKERPSEDVVSASEHSEIVLRLKLELEEEISKAEVINENLQSVLQENAELQVTEKRMNDLCRELEARLDLNLTSVQTTEQANLEEQLHAEIESLSKAPNMSDPEFCAYVKAMIAENLKLMKETFQLRAELVKLSSKCSHLDSDMQDLLQKDDKLRRSYEQLLKTCEHQRQVIEQFESEQKRLAAENGQLLPDNYEAVIAVFKDRHRVQTEELVTVQQRFDLLEKDTARFVERMKQLDATNDAKLQSQLETALKQLEKLSTDRFDLQTKVLDLKQQNADLSRAATEKASTAPAIASGDVRDLQHSLDYSLNKAQHVNGDRSGGKQASGVQTDGVQTVGVNTTTQDLLQTKCTSTTTNDLVDVRSMSTSTNDSFFQDLLSAAIAEHVKKAEEQVADNEDEQEDDLANGKLTRTGFVDGEIEDIALSEEVIPKRVAKKLAAANSPSKKTPEAHNPMVNDSVQAWSEEDELRAKLDEALQKLSAELEHKTILLEQIRMKEEQEREMEVKLAKMGALESELAVLADTIKLVENEKARLNITLEDARRELEKQRVMLHETTRKLDAEKHELKSHISELQEELETLNQRAKQTRGLLETELEFKERQVANRQRDNEELQRRIGEHEEEIEKLKEKQESLKAELTRTNNLVDEANAKLRTAASSPLFLADLGETSRSIQSGLASADQTEAVQILKNKVTEVEKEMRKEKKLHQISKDHCRSVENENEDLRRALAGKKRLEHSSHEPIDFSGRSKHDVVSELIMQSQAHAKKVLETVHAGMNETFRMNEADSAHANATATIPMVHANGSSDYLLQATL